MLYNILLLYILLYHIPVGRHGVMG